MQRMIVANFYIAQKIYQSKVVETDTYIISEFYLYHPQKIYQSKVIPQTYTQTDTQMLSVHFPILHVLYTPLNLTEIRLLQPVSRRGKDK